MRTDESKFEAFDRSRRRLFNIAYRMLGTRDDAEDVVQEAYIRWHDSDDALIVTPEAWLVTVTTRLAIDRLRKAAADRERYIGPWLPEPLVADPTRSPEEEAEFASDLSLAFMAMLERLSPVERAAFILHDVFDVEYPEIARIVGKTEAASRQMIHRARERVRSGRSRFRASDEERIGLIRKFAAASFAGDETQLMALFADDVALTSDGGGKITAARKVITGKRKIAHLFAITASKNREHLDFRIVDVNGEIGAVDLYKGKPFAVTSFTVDDGKISAIYRVMNPDKLKAFAETGRENNFGAVSQNT